MSNESTDKEAATPQAAAAPALDRDLPHPFIKPGRGRILVLRDSAQKRSEGGIHIPETAQKKTRRGYVIAAGDGCAYQRGARVHFGWLSGIEVELPIEGDYVMLLDNLVTSDVLFSEEASS